ncbi:MAG TPA: hypothetical protein VGR95_16830, partial [Thermoanaerobaculia bacterium]|nr:hypothetical protein [Thermoanaerobaculia bacterium]
MDVRQLHTRFLWPFLLGDRAVDDVARELANGWRHESLPRLYSDELLKQARDFIDHDVAYFKYEDARSVFPQRLSAVLSDGVIVPVKIPPRAGIELFVTGEGVGILSIMLTVSAEDIPAAVLLDFNYRVGRKSNALPAMLHVMHPSEDDARWSSIEEAARAKIRPAPSDDAPPSERIGIPG